MAILKRRGGKGLLGGVLKGVMSGLADGGIGGGNILGHIAGELTGGGAGGSNGIMARDGDFSNALDPNNGKYNIPPLPDEPDDDLKEPTIDDAIGALDGLMWGPEEEICFEGPEMSDPEILREKLQFIDNEYNKRKREDNNSPGQKKVKFDSPNDIPNTPIWQIDPTDMDDSTIATGTTSGCNCDCKKKYTCEEKAVYNCRMKESCKPCRKWLLRNDSRFKRKPYKRRYYSSYRPRRSYGRRRYGRY